MQLGSRGDNLHKVSDPIFYEKIRKISFFHLLNLPVVWYKGLTPHSILNFEQVHFTAPTSAFYRLPNNVCKLLDEWQTV